MAGSSDPDFPALGEAVAAERLIGIRFRWYSRQARRTRAAYLGLGLVQLVAALLIALSVALDVPVWFAPALGGAIALAEGVRTLFGLRDEYPTYRRTAEDLRNEAWLYSQRAGRYAEAADPASLLAERVVELSTTETAHWASAVRERST
ncbi:uncharacterized protein DUF4231 [Kribbella amoyensis]|uniref:Uncharacterized protein DUF4231 n=1 Tax=Kribbella amoyensis TaxID=996641 RepID=A0A561B917_9ACTN|nr:DUF4231 domain-containing protein [Kribbella amoyensis]TWD75289.1 uncharacterized protein DUF4231 [Kribbella amoyensis]